MPRTPRPIRLAEFAKLLGCPVEGSDAVLIAGFASLLSARKDELVFLRDASHRPALVASDAGAVIAPPDIEVDGRPIGRLESGEGSGPVTQRLSTLYAQLTATT